MKISYNWLKQYVDIKESPSKLSEMLTNCGLEVEAIDAYQSIKGNLEGVVVGEVIQCEKHPNADKLSVTQVNIGKEKLLQIVCGAPNVAVGQKVLVATIGTVLETSKGPLQIKEAVLRGVNSQGMICAEDELGLGTSHDGIMVLEASAKIGISAKKYFKVYTDTIFEIGLTPNRNDAASHIGVARDVVAVVNTHSSHKAKLILPSVKKFNAAKTKSKISVAIEDKENCWRYSGVIISDVKVGDSPEWLKNYLKAIDVRPINNIVDVTNYIMFELGQPLHAFDADQIKGQKVIVKKFPKGTKFITLDEIERELNGQELMICNTQEPMCMAGVFGGIGSGVDLKTQNVFLESACFNPSSVRKTAKHHGLKTESSFRFERGSDPEITIYALKRAALLIEEVSGGKVSSAIVDVYPKPIKNKKVELYFDYLNQLAGKVIEKGKVKTILTSLGIEIIKDKKELLQLSIPTAKIDVTREIDVVEEILRVYGYNNIPFGSHVNSCLAFSEKPDKEYIKQKVSNYLCSNGFHEIMNNSLTKADYYSNCKEFDSNKNVAILNPLSKELNVLRQSMLFGGLESIRHNVNRKNNDLKLFEFGTIYFKEANSKEALKKYHEEQHIGLFITGKKYNESWYIDDKQADFFFLKGQINSILDLVKMNLSDLKQSAVNNDVLQGVSYLINNQTLVSFGKVSAKLLKAFDLKQDVFYADVHWDLLMSCIKNKTISYQELPKFPEVRRDLALLVDKHIKYEELEKLAFKTEQILLKNVSLFDVYHGEKIQTGKKSYAMSFILRDDAKTLTDKEIDQVMSKLVSAYKNEFEAEIR